MKIAPAARTSIALLLPGVAFSQVATSHAEQARDLLEKSLKDKNPETRTHAVESLGLASATEPWLTELEAMLDDKDVEIRAAAIASVAQSARQHCARSGLCHAKALWTLNETPRREALFSAERRPRPRRLSKLLRGNWATPTGQCARRSTPHCFAERPRARG